MTIKPHEDAYAHEIPSILRSRAVCWLERLVLLVAALFLFAHSMPRAWRTLNTDFPNYYIAARLVHEGYDTSRMYEWQWIEREKDHRALDIRVIGLLPITPFSTLAVYPLVGLAPLAAKHIWILLSLACLLPIGLMLRSMTGLSGQRTALIILLSFPLHRNLLYGQFYVVLLLLIVAACFSYLRGYRALAGALLAIAAACKIFPLLLFAFFLQRRDWRALVSGTATGIAALALSIGVFGWNVHRTWLQEILPWVTRGEGLGTYAITASISGVLHVLFLSEPQWNPHPWHDSPLLYASLAPTLQMLALAPAILLIRRSDNSRSQILLEWSGVLTAALAISTIPASYNFVLMVFPVCVVSALLLQKRSYGSLIALIVAYLVIGFPLPVPQQASGLSVLLYVPRLPAMLAVLVGIYSLLLRTGQAKPRHDWSRYVWAGTMAATALLSVRSTLRLERGERQEYTYRVPIKTQGFLNENPQATPHGIRYSAFMLNGYQVLTQNDETPTLASGVSETDELSFASASNRVLIERAGTVQSDIIDIADPSHVIVSRAREPMLSSDGVDLAFLRDDHGRGQLMLRHAFNSNTAEIPLTAPRLNVYEASFHSDYEYAFSATELNGTARIFVTDSAHTDAPVLASQSRYPAISPDGKWMAYSHLEHGVWNLWLRNQTTGASQRVADVPCNQIQPSWESDSKTLLYGTDCGRSIWFTAIARRKVLP
jgi:hypothetical protein